MSEDEAGSSRGVQAGVEGARKAEGRRYSEDWHNDQCRRDKEYVNNQTGAKSFFCLTHNQWASELPVAMKTTFIYGDKTTLVKFRKLE